MISNAENENMVLSGLRKAAIAMVTLGDEVASRVFPYLTDEDVQLLSREISKLSEVSAEQAERVLAEVHELQLAQRHFSTGGLEYAKRLLNSAYGPDRARNIIDRLVRSLGNEIPTFDALQKADPQQVAKFIQGENPQTIALVLSHLNSGSAAGMLMALPTEIRTDVAMRMANLEQISPDIVRRIASILEQKLRSLGQFSRESYGGVPAVAEMFNRMEANSGQELLEQIEGMDGELGLAIRNLMFVFEDLLLVDQIGMREVLSRVDKKALTTALKGTSEKLREHFFVNMSERGATMLKEDMDAMGPVKIREVETAQQEILQIVRQLESEGVLSLKGAVGEQYVV
ncbi:MAG: flagellar motor switch protein FliG [Acidobacteria bacterium]|nr:flagellar motor switch protein FliG [Acidobacteriota bacterium]